MTISSGELSGAEPSSDEPSGAGRSSDEAQSTSDSTADTAGDTTLSGAARQRERAARQRRLDAVFGDVLPATAEDQREPGERSGFSPEYYRENRPPHHGG